MDPKRLRVSSREAAKVTPERREILVYVMFNTRGSSVNASKKYRLGDLPAIEYFEIQSV